MCIRDSHGADPDEEESDRRDTINIHVITAAARRNIALRFITPKLLKKAVRSHLCQSKNRLNEKKRQIFLARRLFDYYLRDAKARQAAEATQGFSPDLSLNTRKPYDLQFSHSV